MMSFSGMDNVDKSSGGWGYVVEDMPAGSRMSSWRTWSKGFPVAASTTSPTMAIPVLE